MGEIVILIESDLRSCVRLDGKVVDVIDDAFAKLATGGVIMPPILSMAIAQRHGEVDVKTAYVPGLDAFAIKVSPGFFDNPKRGLPSLSGLMVLLSAETGVVISVLLDNGYLTDIRTAAAGAVAARHLAPAEIRTAGILGAGLQAELQIWALRLVRDFDELAVWARDSAKAEAYAGRMRDGLNIPVRSAKTAEEVVRSSDIVITTTPSRIPLIKSEWLHPGLHITAMGSDSPEKNELDPAILARADRFVCDRRNQSSAVGEMRAAIAAGTIPVDAQADELGEICARQKPGRRSDREVTVCDLTGTGIQDTAIANHAFSVARDLGLGQRIVN